MISQKQLLDLANKIKKYIKQDFEETHLSGNLMENINVTLTSKGISIEIPAEMYDIKKFLREGVIVYTGEGSYAEQVDEVGGFSRKHKNYVEIAIRKALREWLTENNFKVKEYVEL